MKTTDVPGTFRDMWETRPSRPRDDRMVAGVAAGIARRYDIDPVLVRVAFVVAAFSGIGAALYLFCWITFPEDPADPNAKPAARHPLALLAGGIAIAIGLGGIFDNSGSLILPAIAVAVLLYLLHSSRADRGPVGPQPQQPADPEAATEEARVSLVKDLPGLPPQPKPPSWDPLGAAPFAWDLPEPSPPPTPAPAPRKLPVTAVTLGAALLASGITAAIMLITGTLTVTTAPTVLGVALAVLGAGLVIGSFLRAGRGLIPFALLLSMVTWGMLAAPLDRISAEGGFGRLSVRPASADQVEPSYSRGAGDIDLDLRDIDLRVPVEGPATPIQTKLTTGAGDITIVVPRDADVTFTGTSSFGDVSFEGRQRMEGPGSRLTITDLGADGVASGRPIVIDARAGGGDVEVKRD
ncbi:PspC domain-containing protein [Pseudonocardia thermophila]|jgi:Putative stress-responsive transcriptional regulator|uniref:PspC domain-containing protein n=1 Tax=Pseudonocardia thermophila TaxID=1848 RepID=UPI00248E391E|nr:PspC domain-containing protein [Pseudonocardia thermophila]